MKVLFVVNNFYAKGNGLSGSARRTVRKLKEAGFNTIVCVDDGSSEEYRHFFDELQNVYGCDVLRHCVNMGKGRGIKTSSFSFCLSIKKRTFQYSPIQGVKRYQKAIIIIFEPSHFQCRDFETRKGEII